MKRKFFTVLWQSQTTLKECLISNTGYEPECVIYLKEVCGPEKLDFMADIFRCKMRGADAMKRFRRGDLVMASLRFLVTRANKHRVQEVTVTNIKKIRNYGSYS